MFLFIVSVFAVLIPFDCLPPSQECRYWLIFVEIRARVAKFDVIDGFSLLTP